MRSQCQTITELEAEARRLERIMIDAEAEMNLRPDPDAKLYWRFVHARDICGLEGACRSILTLR